MVTVSWKSQEIVRHWSYCGRQDDLWLDGGSQKKQVGKHKAFEQTDGGDLSFVYTPMEGEAIHLWGYRYVD